MTKAKSGQKRIADDGAPANLAPDTVRGQALADALNVHLRDSLPQMAFAFGVLFAVFAISHLAFLTGTIRVTMVVVAAITAAVDFTVWRVLQKRPLPARWAHPVAAALSGAILINTLLHLYLSADPLQTTNVVLFVIGLGFILFSTVWWGVMLGAGVVGWLLVVLALPPDPAWFHFGFAMLSALTVSLVVHLVRRRTYKRLETLRLQDEKRQVHLQATLNATERIQRALETTVGVSQRITSVLDLETLLVQVVELIKERYGYYHVSIFLLDEAETYIELRAGTGEAGESLRQQSFRLRVGEEGLIGWVAKHRQPLNIKDVSQESRYMPVASMPDTRSELVLPLEVADEILGVLDIQSEKLWAFHDDDVQVLEALTGQVAIAIQNAVQYQAERKRRLFAEKLQDVGRALARTMKLSDVLDLILAQVDAIVPFDRGAVMLEQGEEMIFRAARGFPKSAQPLNMRVKIKEGDIYLDIRETREPMLIPDVRERTDWQYVEGLPPARAWLGVPLVHEDHVIGMLSLTRERPEPYQPDEVTLAAAFAGQAAVALENARLYDNLRVTYAQLERLDRTKSDFIEVASHELRTPLTVLDGYCQMLLGDAAIKENAYHYQLVEGIDAGIGRLQTIMESMLDMAKIDSRVLQLNPEPYSLDTLIQSVYRRLVSVAQERNLTLMIEDLSNLPSIMVDTEAIRKVFYHLMVNAIKYTPDGGSITVSGRSLLPGDKLCPEGGVEIAVRDTGIGIDPSVQQLIFAKFYQTGEVALHSTGATKFKGGGPGLGLAIARGIVEAHGGSIWVESPGHDEATCPGSTFYVALPLDMQTLLSVDVGADQV